jgi:hypothetical protein
VGMAGADARLGHLVLDGGAIAPSVRGNRSSREGASGVSRRALATALRRRRP